jgi:hypothetical protein
MFPTKVHVDALEGAYIDQPMQAIVTGELSRRFFSFFYT